MPFPEEYGGLGGSVDRHGDHRRGNCAHSSADFVMAYRRQRVLRPQCPAQGLGRAEAALAAEAAVGRDQDVDLDVRARCRLGYRRDAHHGAARRRPLGHQRPEAVGDRRRRQATTSSIMYVKTDSAGALPPGHVAVPRRQRHARASRCASSTCSGGAASGPTRSSSTMCACRPTGSSAARTRAGTACCRACRSSASPPPRALAAAAQAVFDLALALRQGAQAVRPADRHVPGDRAHARRHADRGRGGAHPDVARGVAGRHGAERAARDHHGQAVRRPRPTSRSPIWACRSSAATATTWNSTCSAISAIRAPPPSPPASSQIQRNLHRRSHGPQGAVAAMETPLSVARLLRPRSVAIVGASPEPGAHRQQRAGQSRALGLCRRDPSRQPQPHRDRRPPLRADDRRSAAGHRRGGAGRAGSGGARCGRGLRAAQARRARSCSPSGFAEGGAEGRGKQDRIAATARDGGHRAARAQLHRLHQFRRRRGAHVRAAAARRRARAPRRGVGGASRKAAA